MIRRLAIASIFSLALAGCATYDSGYRHGYADAHKRDASNDGYDTTVEAGYADASDGRPLYMWDAYDGYGYPCSGFGYGFGYFPDRDDFGFEFGSRFGYDPWTCNPWYGYGAYFGWYRPPPQHRHHDHHGHDHDGPPGGWAGSKQVGVVRMQFATTTRDRSGVRIIRPARHPGFDDRNERDSMRWSMMQDGWHPRDGDTFRTERRGLPGNRSHSHDGVQK